MTHIIDLLEIPATYDAIGHPAALTRHDTAEASGQSTDFNTAHRQSEYHTRERPHCTAVGVYNTTLAQSARGKVPTGTLLKHTDQTTGSPPLTYMPHPNTLNNKMLETNMPQFPLLRGKL